MKYGELVEGRFLTRLNRFAALVYMEGREVQVHVANSGRMKELLVAGRRVLLRPAPGDHRKTQFDLALVDLGHTLSSADARLPNVVLYEALEAGVLPRFAGYDEHLREVTFGDCRLDLALRGPRGTCYIEAKSVTLVEDGTGLFPDAPTIRGTKHVRSLGRALTEGHRAAVVFVVQRDDAQDFAPNDAADPEFGAALREAVGQGVEAYAYRCRVTAREIELGHELPVRL